MAVAKSLNRGRRTVPPQPGSIPSPVSGKPIFALEETTLASHDRQTSSPPPKAKPLIATTVGNGISSIADIMPLM